MKVYVVSEICDYEYYCTSVVFVTANEEIAKQYCKKNSVIDNGWDGIRRSTITYKEHELTDNPPERKLYY